VPKIASSDIYPNDYASLCTRVFAMKPIFIDSTKQRELTRALAAAIEAQYGEGSVWWDHALESWGHYEIQIRNALHQARAVVVIWSKEAGESDWAGTKHLVLLLVSPEQPLFLTFLPKNVRLLPELPQLLFGDVRSRLVVRE
jgi:hypothetical protein